MTNDRVELMLEQLGKYQDKLAYFMAAGFIVGFLIGVISAWAMLEIAK